MQQRRPVVLATAAAVVLAIAVVAALVTWGYVRGQTPSGSPLAVAVVFAAVLTAGAVGLVILAGRPELDPAGRNERVRSLVGRSGDAVASADDTGDASDAPSGRTDAAPDQDADPPTAEQPRSRSESPPREHSPRTALDPLGRRYGRHARTEAGPDPDEPPVPSELQHPLPSDLAATLHDQLFTHRSSARE